MRFRKTACILLSAVIMAAGGTGCSGDVHPSADPDTRTLRVGTPMQVRQVNPLADYSYSTLAMLATHDTLVRLDADLTPIAQLARQWQASVDARQWRFRIRSDAHWHDGRPVQPEDVKFTFDYLAGHHGAFTWLGSLIRGVRVEGTDVIFDLTQPYSRFLIDCGFVVRILPRHIWQTVANPLKPGPAAVTLGCGPLIYEDFDPRAGVLTFVRNPAYYGAPAAVDRLEIFLHRTFDTLTLSLLRGDIDMYYKYASGFPAAYLPRLKKATGVGLLLDDARGVPAALGFNLNKGPAAQVVFRRALAAALDYARIQQSLLGNLGRRPDAGFVPMRTNGYPLFPKLSCDPDKSRLLLAENGYRDSDGDGLRNTPDGSPLQLTLLARADLEGTDALLSILRHNLQAVGIDLHLERVDLATWIERIRQQHFDLVLFRTTPWGMVMGAGSATGYFDSRRKGGGTLANVVDPAFHTLCDRLLASIEADRQQELQQDIRQYYAAHLPAVALCWAVHAYPMSARLQGVIVHPIEGGLLNRRTLAKLRPVRKTAMDRSQ